MSAAVCFAAACLFATYCEAAIVQPGERLHFTAGERLPPDSEWRGELLAERSDPFEFSGQTPEEPMLTASGTATSRVFRDAGTGGLAFLYSVSGQSESIVDLDQVMLSSFASFTTDVFSNSGDFGVARSADGATLDFGFNAEGLGGNLFLVRSDATSFDENGSSFIEIDFVAHGVKDRATFPSFQPLADDGGGGGPNPIPLPPAAWAALATAGALGAAGKARGWLRRSR
jgi:hypothetical protein